MKAKERRTITVMLDTTAASLPAPLTVNTDKANIYIPFTPDEVVVRQVSIFNAIAVVANFETLVVTSDIVENYPLFVIPMPAINTTSVIPLTTKFQINRPVSGTFNFFYLNSAGNQSGIRVQLMIVLEFIKY